MDGIQGQFQPPHGGPDQRGRACHRRRVCIARARNALVGSVNR